MIIRAYRKTQYLWVSQRKFFQNFTTQLTKFYKAIYTLLPFMFSFSYKKIQQNKMIQKKFLQKNYTLLTDNFFVITRIACII